MNNNQNHKMEIVREKKICVEGKNEAHFFENVLTDIMEKGYLSEETMQSIQVELINLWTMQIEAFNRGKSSSITEGNAKALLESIYHTLGFRLKALEDLDESITLLQHQSIKVLFEEGQEIIEKRYEVLKEQYQTLMGCLLPTENMAYRDTYDEGLAPFFKEYSPKFHSHECPCSIDYYLSNDRLEAVGIDYMVSYIENSLLEHELCLKFKAEEIEGILEGYHKGYRELLINIFEMVLMNAIGRLISGKNLESLYLEEADQERIEKQLEILPTDVLERTLVQKGMEVLEQLGLTSLKMKTYTTQTIKKSVPRVELAIEQETLDKIFIVTKNNLHNIIQYEGGIKLSNEAFRALTEKIRDCKESKEKVQWIKQKVQHVEDLRDVLEADCIFGEEYEDVYQELEDIEIALLLNLMKVDENDHTEVEMDKEWFIYLKKYLNELPTFRQEAIEKMAQNIKQG